MKRSITGKLANWHAFAAKNRQIIRERDAARGHTSDEETEIQMGLIGQFYTGTDRAEVVHRVKAKDIFLDFKSVFFYCTIVETKDTSIRRKSFDALNIDFVEYFTADIWAARDRDNGKWVVLEIVHFEKMIKLKRVF